MVSGRLGSSLVEGLVGDMSLIPRLWPDPFCSYALELIEETVLVRLGGNGLEDEEYADELVEAFDAV